MAGRTSVRRSPGPTRAKSKVWREKGVLGSAQRRLASLRPTKLEVRSRDARLDSVPGRGDHREWRFGLGGFFIRVAWKAPGTGRAVSHRFCETATRCRSRNRRKCPLLGRNIWLQSYRCRPLRLHGRDSKTKGRGTRAVPGRLRLLLRIVRRWAFGARTNYSDCEDLP